MGDWIWLRITSMMVLILAFGRGSASLHSGGTQPEALGGFGFTAFFSAVLVSTLIWLLGNLARTYPKAAGPFVAILILAQVFCGLVRGTNFVDASAILKTLAALLMGAAKLTL